MSVAISVIVTVYNHEVRYFRECMESLRSQTFRDIEFIIVDNDATPASKIVIEEYEKLDSRFKVIHLKENKGYGRALNVGLKAAVGEYVAFVDSDDWAESDMYEKLWMISQRTSADIIKGLFYICADGEEKKLGLKFPSRAYNKALMPNEVKFYPLSFGSFWSAIYKRSMIVENDIWFDEVPAPSAEDIMFTLRTYFFAKSIYLSPEVVFDKRMDNPNSSMKRKDSKAWTTLKLYNMLENFIGKNEDKIPKELLGVKSKREYLNFYWLLKNDVSRNRLGYYLCVSKIYRHNLKRGHVDFSLFNPEEAKLYLKIAKNPIRTWLSELLYKRKITSTHEKRYLLGVQYYSKRSRSGSNVVSGNSFAQSQFELLHSTWQTSGVTDELVQYLRLLSQSRYAFKKLREEFMYIYIACLIEKNLIEEARKIVKMCSSHFKFENLFRYIYVSDFLLCCGVSNEKSQKAAYIMQCFERNLNSGEFVNYLRGKKIAVVGNSGCELGKGKGAEIDAHDVVIRFGNFPYEYIKDYGSKTNVWVRAGGAYPGDVESREIDDIEYVLWNQDFKHSVIMHNLLDYMYDSCTKFPKKYLYIGAEYRKSFAEASNINFPSSGAMLFWYLFKTLKTLDNVDFYGFAFLDNNSQDFKHFFDNKCKISTEHNFSGECEFLHWLYQNNKDVCLSTKV